MKTKVNQLEEFDNSLKRYNIKKVVDKKYSKNCNLEKNFVIDLRGLRVMIDRIKDNEDRLDSILLSVKELNNALYKFKYMYDNIVLLNKYYGSNDWFKDKDAYENNNISKIKAGVLSEDAIWNMNEEIKELIIDLEEIVNVYKKLLKSS